ncbi:MAG: SDR family oxidoreductase [Pseudomonadota bacterium]
MKLQSNQVVLLTGASGGLGAYIARQFAELGLKQMLVAYPGTELPPLKDELTASGVDAAYMVADLRQPAERARVVQETKEKFGKIDVLINNAGIEFTAPYDTLDPSEIDSVLDVNLVAPMQLTRLVLGEMLERGSGHIVNMSSLAGKAHPAYQEPYAASKAGLIGFTHSIRESYHNTGVSASVICPGFVEAGIYTRLKQNSGLSAPFLLGTSAPEKVSKAVVRSIESNQPEVVINPIPVKPLLATTVVAPKLGAWLLRSIGAHRFFKDVYRTQNN